MAGLSNDPLGELKTEITNEINYLATLKLVELAKKNKVKRFIFASTQSIYGLSKLKKELDEDLSKKNPISAYAITKYKAEKKIHNMSSDDFVTTSLRPSTVFGPSPRLRTDIVFNNLLASAYTNSKIEIWGNGKSKREVIFVDDLANAIIYFSFKKINTSILNIGTEQEMTIEQYAKLIMKALNVNLKIKYVRKNLNGTPRKILDCTVARQLGWKILFSLEEGLKITILDFIKNFNKYK